MSLLTTNPIFTVFPSQGRISGTQRRNEVFISVVQLVVLSFFTVLGYRHGLLDHPYIFLLTSFYAGFVALKAILCMKVQLPIALLSVSASIDIVMPLLLMWIIAGNFDHLSDFSLFNQSIYFYLLISIGLRVLHYNVGLTFFSSAIGFCGLFAIFYYKSSVFSINMSLLSREEIDALIGFGLFTSILVILTFRSRQVEAKRIAEQQRVQSFSRFFAEGVAQKIRNEKQPLKAGQGEIREAAVLFIDLKGFTKLTHELPPNQIMLLLGEYQARMLKTIYACNGDIDKFLGDGIMASFGAVTKNNSFAADAMRAADQLIKDAKDWKEERRSKGQISPSVGMGLAVGDVIFGAVGDDTRMEFTLIGDAVNLAAKLEKHTRKEDACFITTHKTLDLAIQQGYVDQGVRNVFEKEHIRGLENPIDLLVTH